MQWMSVHHTSIPGVVKGAPGGVASDRSTMPTALVASGSPLEFGYVLIGTEARRSLVYTNHSQSPAVVSGVEPMASSDGRFVVGNAYSGDVAPSEGVGILVRFIPTAEKYYEGEFVFLVLSAHTIEPATVRGTGVAFIERGALKIGASHAPSGGALDCGIVPLGEKTTVAFDIRNNRDQPIVLTDSWSHGQQFWLVNPVVGIAETSSLRLEVVFAPHAPGIAYDVLRIADATGFDRIDIAVQGTGTILGDFGALTAPAAHSSTSGAANELDFGDVLLGSSKRIAFYVSNSSDNALELSAKLVRGGQGFSVLEPHPLQMVVPAHDQLGFVVEFEPPNLSDYDDHLVIAAGHRDYVVRRLHGRGVNPLSTDHD